VDRSLTTTTRRSRPGPTKDCRNSSRRARKCRGWLITDYATRFGKANERLATWVANGDLVHRESVVEGLENAPDAFLGLFSGDNIGKQVVRVAE